MGFISVRNGEVFEWKVMEHNLPEINKIHLISVLFLVSVDANKAECARKIHLKCSKLFLEALSENEKICSDARVWFDCYKTENENGCNACSVCTVLTICSPPFSFQGQPGPWFSLWLACIPLWRNVSLEEDQRACKSYLLHAWSTAKLLTRFVNDIYW